MIITFTFHFELVNRKKSLTWKPLLWAMWAGLNPACQDTLLDHCLEPKDDGQTFIDWLLTSSPDAANSSPNGVQGTLGYKLPR